MARHRYLILALGVALTLAVSAAPAAEARPARLAVSVAKIAALEAGGTRVIVQGSVVCAAGEQVVISVVLRQGKGKRVSDGADYDLFTCTGQPMAWSLVLDGLFPGGRPALPERLRRQVEGIGPQIQADISGAPYQPGKARARVSVYEMQPGGASAQAQRTVKLVKAD